MRDRVVVLAVTRMLSGMCVGGISLDSGEWVRPVKEHRTILPGDLTYPDGTPIRPFDVVEFSLSKRKPTPPHIEDWVCDFVRERPALVRRLSESERWEFLDKRCEPDAIAAINASRRSLCLLGPQDAQALFALDSYSGKYDARLYLPALGRRPAPVTDIKWRAFGRRLTAESDRVVLRGKQLLETFGAELMYPAIGLSRLHEGRFWPLVVGVHCLPDYEAEVDYRNL